MYFVAQYEAMIPTTESTMLTTAEAAKANSDMIPKVVIREEPKEVTAEKTVSMAKTQTIAPSKRFFLKIIQPSEMEK